MEFIKKNQQYKEVSYSEREEEEYLSSTEVESQHGADEKQSTITKTERRRRSRPRRSRTSLFVAEFRRFRWLVDFVLLIVNISLSVVLLRGFNQENATSTMQVGSNFDGTGPDFPTKIVKFEADPAFVPNDTTEFFSAATLEQWNTMMPVGTGWGAETTETFFTTSMTHQLHCLFMMGRIYAAFTGGMTEKLPSDYHTHYLHCIDYLRQGIMCSADLTMEPHEQTDPDDNGPKDGSWNGHHVCKDYGHVIPYLEEQIGEGIRKVLPIDD
ncbi:uncharacterized protein N0V89_006072 [Didymosphaeria variabile]|uniref:Oxidase ustYa n=1 Tax=Didymosphaeria variabile TaxID=1932322 RepID=A0A9W9CBT9_9PLEO|nr:uncharacterized protein N0V89_006072 [Didymosphaeria variabile]KAJ4354337.1 hypothetical protein N0V89_006072 [Didymosphaeria variabile]